MARRVPALLAQVQQLLDNGGGSGAAGEGRAAAGKQQSPLEGKQDDEVEGEEGEGRGRRLSRRAAVNECIEELFGQMTRSAGAVQRALPLPPPAFASRR
jgi:hypothetical protein